MARTRIFDGGFVPAPAPHLLVNSPVKLYIVALHMLGKVLPYVLNGPVTPLPAGHPPGIPAEG